MFGLKLPPLHSPIYNNIFDFKNCIIKIPKNNNFNKIKKLKTISLNNNKY